MKPKEKAVKYKDLVAKRKACNECKKLGLQNPYDVNKDFDCDEIGAWSVWQGSLDAQILVVGQDWADVNFYIKHEGNDTDDNPTNLNLIKLLSELGEDVDLPSSNIKNKNLFFTNAVLCLKSGNMGTAIAETCYRKCGKIFLKRLIEIISPRVIITLGVKAYQTVMNIYDKPAGKLKSVVADPVKLDSRTVLFPVYHCGAKGVNINRKIDKQVDDWKRIAQQIKEKRYLNDR